MKMYKYQIILDPNHRNKSSFKVGDLVIFDSSATLDYDIRNIKKNKVGIVRKIRWFYKESLNWANEVRETECELEIFWSPSNDTTYEREDTVIKVSY